VVVWDDQEKETETIIQSDIPSVAQNEAEQTTYIIDNIPTSVNASTLTMIETELWSSLLRDSQARHKCRKMTTSTARQSTIMMTTTMLDTL
jgi:hypothetical protein